MWAQQKVYIDSPRKSLEAQEKKKKNSQKTSVISCTQEDSFRKYAIIYGKTVYCKESAESFNLSIYFSTQYFHYLHKLLPPCSKISCDGLHLLQHVACCPPPSHSPCLLEKHKPLFPVLSPASCLPDSSEQNGPQANQTRYSCCTQVHQAVNTVSWYVTAASAKASEISLRRLYSAEGISREKTFFSTVCSNANSCRSSCSVTFIWHWRGLDTLFLGSQIINISPFAKFI